MSRDREECIYRPARTKISNGKKEEYTWDHRNRLTKITFKNSDQTVTKTVDQFYDVFNRWVRRCVDPNGSNDVDTFFSYEDGQVALQFDDGGAASDLGHRYLLNPDVVDQLLADEQVTSLTTAGTMLRPFGDHLGTLRDLATYNASTDDTAIANHRRYDSFGKLISETVSAVDEIFGFTGRALDDSTGLQNNLNRWYDSAVGRWVSEDPKGFHANDRNLNRYVANSSLVLVDPTGLQPPGGPYDKPRDDGGPFEKALDEASPELRRLMLELYELQRRGDLGAYQELIQIIDRLDRPSHEVEISRREFDCQINNVLPFYKDYLYALYRFQSAMEQANAALKEVAAALAAYNKARYDLQKAIFDYSAPPPIREPAPGSEGNPAPDPSALEQAMKLNKIRLAQIAVAAALNALQAAGLKGLIAAAAANYWWDEVQKAKGVLDQKLSENKVTICTELDRRTKQTWPWLPIPERKPRRGPGER